MQSPSASAWKFNEKTLAITEFDLYVKKLRLVISNYNRMKYVVWVEDAKINLP